jgi:predicted CXXCH cytochrome family protein
MFCHNAYPENLDGERAKFPTSLPQGIDCQRCHGPGKDHIQAAQAGASLDAVRRAIVNPARLNPARQMEVCLQCHLETTSLRLPASLVRYERNVFSYRAGEPLEDYILHFDRATGTGNGDSFEFISAPYRLRESACFRMSRGALTCTTCHNPHDIPRGAQAMAQYSQVCRNCHAAVSERIRQGLHPAADECVSCHMPKGRPADAIHVTVTDHFIRKRPELRPSSGLVERHDGNSQPYRGPVALYYPESLSRTPENELYLAAAQVLNQANLERGIPRLEAAIAAMPVSRVEFYLDLAAAYRNSGGPEKAIPVYQKAAAMAPSDWRGLFELGTTLAVTGNLAGSAQALQRAVVLGPQETEPLEALAKTLLRQGKAREAVTLLEKASDLAPDTAGIRSELGIALLHLGNAQAAEKSMREALRLRPEIAEVHVNLAELLSRRKSFAEARHHFEMAIRLDGTLAEARSAYGAALAAEGRLAEARAQYEATLRIDSRLFVTHNNLGVVLLRLGDSEGSMREYRLAIAVRPNYAVAHYNLALALAARGRTQEAEKSLEDAVRYSSDYFEAHLKLGQMFAARGAAALAEPHLKKARQSPDPAVRKAALEAAK